MARPVAPRGQGRERVLEAAAQLFAEHGVHGTSLQMIADRLGVGKAAVYFQFQTKDEMVLALVGPILGELAEVATDAEALPTPHEQREAAITGLVAMVVRHRRLAAVFFGDPAVAHLIREHAELQASSARLVPLLLGPDPDAGARVAVAMLGAGLMYSGADPQLADLDDASLYRELLCHALLLMTPQVRQA